MTIGVVDMVSNKAAMCGMNTQTAKKLPNSEFLSIFSWPCKFSPGYRRTVKPSHQSVKVTVHREGLLKQNVSAK